MVKWLEQYSGQATNASIAATASEFFAQDASARQNRSRYGSMNSLLVSYTGTAIIEVELDGTVFARFSNASMTIKPEDGNFFNIIKITNKDAAAAIAAGDIIIRWGRSRSA